MNRPLRSFLFSPANHPRRVEKVFMLGADAAILDLEDAVAVTEKPKARTMAVTALQRSRPCLAYVRVNAIDTEFCYDDLVNIVGPGLDGIVLPKVESADGLLTVDWLISQLERRASMPIGCIDIIPIVETGKGLMAVEEIARAGSRRVRRIAFGAGDFTFDMNLTWSANERELEYARSRLVATSRAAGLEPPLDSVWVDLQDQEGLRQSAEMVLRMGFQGKMGIHPSQIAVINDVFSPSADEVAYAERIIAAFDAAEADGSAALQVDGKFIDYPIVYRARRILELMSAIRKDDNALV
ncbi:HpcH/HpaI aldolase/citrate lyase family protein [Aquibaculum arenosum]|uniref:CoA ester lyase n=1 Tax=Aquibaculum arenosum TaxID=3032591 RepID=A0ABT5YR65_9PROT|nr:CoA ester lyase [Fodinicurvata sp. CAU 1616]MDF2097332.1 CoA ester lyase [Fodinicurvata sp. CAU 1616]